MKHAPKTRCSGQWTSARFSSFIKSALRGASNRWQPKYAAKRAAKIGRNQYVCALCRAVVGNKDSHMDHVNPVVDPVRGFNGWDEYIARLFVEQDGYRCLCTNCHAEVTVNQRLVRKQNKPK